MKRYFFIMLALISLFFIYTAYAEELNIEMKRHYLKSAGFSTELPVDWNIQFLKANQFTMKAVEPETKKTSDCLMRIL